MRLVSHIPVRRRLQPGDRVDDHLIIRSVLGKGGTAIVFEALHTRLNSLVALKVVEVDAAFAGDAAARLEREALVCAAIDDVHIPKIYDVGQLDDGTPYIVMEKVSGPTLEHMLQDGPLRPHIALSIVRDLLSALSAVHRACVVHRDIKPSNLIVQVADDGTHSVRLMDFGVSKAMSHHRVDPVITHEGALVGTPHYMAPEQVSDEGLDGRTDVYAAGVVLYELLSGRVPFDGGSSAQVMTAVLRHVYEPLSTWCPQVSSSLAALVARAMAERPEDRFGSAREMRDALDAEIKALERGVPVPAANGTFGARNTALWSLLSVTFAFMLALGSRQVSRAPEGASPGTNQGALARMSKPVPAPKRQVELPRLSSESVRSETSLVAAEPTSRQAARRAAKAASTTRTDARQDEAPTAITTGALVSDYVQQLDELTRTVSDVAADLVPQTLPANPYR